MRSILLRSGFLLGITVLFSACGGSDDGTGGSSSGLVADCQKLCAATTPLKCSKEPADCAAHCQQDLSDLPKCKMQIEAFVHCGAAHPTADWECNSDGEAELKMGCEAEGLALLGCALSGAGGAGP